jgi:hypothetical protein
MQIDKAHTMECFMGVEKLMLLNVIVRCRNTSLKVKWHKLVELLNDLLHDKECLALIQILLIDVFWHKLSRQDQIVTSQTLFE